MNMSKMLTQSQNQQAMFLLGLFAGAGKAISLSDGLDLYLKNHASIYIRGITNIKVYSKALMDCWGDVQLSEINQLAVAQLTRWLLDRDLKNSTVNRHLQFLKAFLNMMRTWGYNSPVIKIKLFPEDDTTRYFSREDIAKMLQSRMLTLPRYRHLKDFLVIDLQTGLRKQELLGLTWDKVDLDAGLIYLSADQTKSKKAQTVCVTPQLADYLRGMMNCSTGQYVIGGSRIGDIKRSFRSLMVKSGVYKPGYCIHTIRHTFASHLVMMGTDLKTIQGQLRHKSIKTTDRYAHLSTSHIQRELSKMSGLVISVEQPA